MIYEVSPPGWGHTKAEKEKTKPEKPKSKIGGTAHAMKLAQKRGDIPKNMNIFALMWSMKNKGDKPHYKPGVKDKLKGKYKGPEGQNEMIDPKKIRNTIMKTCKKLAVDIGSRKKAINTAIKELRPDEILLVAGKGHEKNQVRKNQIRFFDDVQVAKYFIMKKI